MCKHARQLSPEEGICGYRERWKSIGGIGKEFDRDGAQTADSSRLCHRRRRQDERERLNEAYTR